VGSRSFHRGVAQLRGALGPEPRGRRFESCHPDHSAFRPTARTLARLARNEGSNPSGRTVMVLVPNSELLADASGEAIRLSNGTRWVRFPRRAPRPSCVSGLRVRLKPGRSRFDSGGGHYCANRSMVERRHDEAEMSVRFALRVPSSIGGAVGTGHCLASRDKRVRLPPPPLPCRANGSSPEKRETGTVKAAPMTCYLETISRGCGLRPGLRMHRCVAERLRMGSAFPNRSLCMDRCGFESRQGNAVVAQWQSAAPVRRRCGFDSRRRL
jgi:hypothetical protein